MRTYKGAKGRTIVASLTIAMALSIGAGSVAAYAQAQPPMPSQQAPAQQQVSEKDIQVFASALQQVQKIVVAYGPRIEKADDPTQAQKLHAEAQEKMASAVEAEGMSVAQYNQMAKLAESDTQVRDRIKQQMGQ